MESVGACWLEAWAKAHGTHNTPPFSRLGRTFFPCREKNILDMFDVVIGGKREYLLDVGIGEA